MASSAYLDGKSPTAARVLIIDDDEMLCGVLSYQLKKLGHQVTSASTLEDGLKAAIAGLHDIIYLDVRLPDGNGLDILPKLQEMRSSPEVIIMTGAGDPDGAELAIKCGAWDYIEKPSSMDMMVLPFVRALQFRQVRMSKRPVIAFKRETIIGNSPRMRACLDLVAWAAGTDANVLIFGETGTGKELLARAIHDNSSRVDGNFVIVDCAALTETLVESVLFGYEKGAYTGAERSHEGLISQADKGTLFLDEVGELPLSIQKSFLRVLQERRFRPLGSKHETVSDFRLIAATNRNLDRMVQQGKFRKDLLFRLRSFTIETPPLRDRMGDIPELLMYHMRGFCKRHKMEMLGFSPEFLEALALYDWPGNVRELFNALERVYAVAGRDPILFVKHLPTEIRIKIARASISTKFQTTAAPGKGPDLFLQRLQDIREAAVADVEKKYLKDLMSLAGNNIKKACEISGLSRSRLYELIKKYETSGKIPS